MAQAIYQRPERQRKQDAASPITLSATVPVFVALEPGYNAVELQASASGFLFNWVPRLDCAVLYTVAGGSTDYTPSVTDKSSDTHLPLDGMLTTSILYLGTTDIVRGFWFDIGSNANAENASLDMEYYGSSGWADVAGDSDGTVSAAKTLAVDGLYSFTVPACVPATTGDLGLTGIKASKSLFWIRFKPSATLSVTVDINEIIPAAKHGTTKYARYAVATVVGPFVPNYNDVGGLETISVTGTPTLAVNWIQY